MSEEIAEAICRANIVNFGDFKFGDGRQSPIYLNLRILPSYPMIFKFISDKIVGILASINQDVVCGTDSAFALATAVSLKTNLPAIYVRKQRYSQRTMIEGVLNKNQKVVLITDIITNGYNKLRLIDAIRNAGGIIDNIVSVVDKEEGADENLKKVGVTLHRLITLKGLLDYMNENSLIEKDVYGQIVKGAE
jgi:orotate phosphoribosyltransferase